jgi:lysozyme family protein
METNFKSSLDHILKSEGGCQDDPRDNWNKLIAKMQGGLYDSFKAQ